MTLLQKLALVLCLACSCITLSSNAQTIESTGNVVNNNQWNNAVYQNNLTCWAYGDPGYCGPNPIVRPGGNINFSYGTVDLHQIQSIASILPNSGTGLQVNGFTFGFTAKNGNGWDNGRQDYLSAYVTFYNKTGAIAANYDYTQSTNRQYNWTQFNFSETFTTPYAAPELSNVRYGLIGRDNNFWAGPYGPEVMNVNFSLKYSVDPCSTNTFYSPSCAGYFDALAKLAPASTTNTNTVVAYTPPPEPPEPPTPPPGSTTQNQSGPPPPPGAPPPPGSPPPQGSQQPPPPASTPQQTAQAAPQEKASSGPVNLSLALNLIAKNAEKEKALEQQTVAAAVAEAQASSTKAQNETTQTVAALNSMSAQSVETGQAMAASAQASGGSNAARSSGGPQLQQSQGSSGTGLQATAMVGFQQTTQMQQTINSIQTLQVQQQTYQAQEVAIVSYISLQAPQQVFVAPVFEAQQSQQQLYVASANSKSVEVDLPQTQTSFLTDRNNPLREILDVAPITMADFTEQRQDSGNRVVQPNDLAVGIDLTKMAVVPSNYANYLNLALRDASFYEPKEVYKNQTVVDNVRVLRGLGSDQKHQDLVNSQYK